MEATFTEPVNVLGMSTGGSIALQLAADHSELIARPVLGGTACTLGPIGKRAQRAYIDRARRGQRPSPAPAELVTESAIGRALVTTLGWVADGRKDHTDVATMRNAADRYDLRGRLHDGKACTLLFQGAKDLVYPLEPARQTARAILGARLISYPGRSHATTFTDKRFASDELTFLLDG
jgi:pimeloyl-ACP methyl ester carboxylesterase